MTDEPVTVANMEEFEERFGRGPSLGSLVCEPTRPSWWRRIINRISRAWWSR